MLHRPPLPVGPWLVVGLARSGAAAARALWAHGEPVICVDAGTPGEAQALRAEGLEVWTGVEGLAELERARAVVKSPGVPREAPVIAEALRRGLPVVGELEVGWRLIGRPFVAVTGTNGKTTTVELLGEIWRAAGREVAVAGNVGTAVSSLAGRVGAEATIVCEASSFQLEDALAFAPQVGLILNVTPDHLDR
ncbi:MAG: Mur ligase family protein, partial [Solirubrobacteraceae bacterium]|nr:Mur ligase family protein [Solirubrobacteraceae bacterium]